LFLLQRQPGAQQRSRRSTLNVGSWFRQERKMIRCISPQGDIQRSNPMHTALKKFGVAAVAAVSLAGATLVTSTSAEARYFHRGWGGGWAGPAIVGGLALGALAASRPYYGYGYGPGYYGAYGDGYYGGDCVLRRRVHYTPYGPVVRHVRVCY
jgi:hypothetical protein